MLCRDIFASELKSKNLFVIKVKVSPPEMKYTRMLRVRVFISEIRWLKIRVMQGGNFGGNLYISNNYRLFNNVRISNTKIPVRIWILNDWILTLWSNSNSCLQKSYKWNCMWLSFRGHVDNALSLNIPMVTFLSRKKRTIWPSFLIF